jgi:signal transduction histidine kinase
MRRRLVAALAGVAIVTLLVYAGPRAFMIADLVRQQEGRTLDRSIELVAATLADNLRRGGPVDEALLRPLVRDGEELVVRLDDGDTIRTGSLDAGDRTVQASRALPDGGQVTLRLRSQVVDERVAEAMVPVVVIGGASVLVAVVLALLLSRQLTRPFARLAAHAVRISDTTTDPAPRSGIPEADRLADALDHGHVQVQDLLRREREFSSNASHQLRTPLAALRLRLEDLTMWPETQEPVQDELARCLGEIDRLSGTITDLLELARLGGLGAWSEFDLRDAIESTVRRWGPQFEAAGRRLVLLPSPDRPCVATSEQAVQQVLDVVLENALSHGAGVVDVQIEHLRGRAAVRVSDQGSLDNAVSGRVFERSFRSTDSSGSGIGLSLAQTIAESAGARLGLVSRDPTVFELSLPTPTTGDPVPRASAPDALAG